MADQKKLSTLDEVKADAKFNYLNQLRVNKQREEHEAAKQFGSAPDAVLSVEKVQKELGLDQGSEPETSKEESKESSESKNLNQLNKAELQQVAQDEDVEVDENATNAELVQAIEDSRKENK